MRWNIVKVRRSKTDKNGKGYLIAVDAQEDPLVCPLAALGAWLDILPDKTGPLFRRVHSSGKILPYRLGDQTYRIIVKDYAEQLGRDPQDFGGHSTRAGLVTTMWEADISDARICEQSRHSSVEMMRRYVRPEALLNDGVTARLFEKKMTVHA